MAIKNLSDHKKIKMSIIKFFFDTNHGKFTGIELKDFCHAYGLRKEVYPDTVLRYMRELKDEGVIDYERVGKKADSTYLITKVD